MISMKTLNYSNEEITEPEKNQPKSITILLFPSDQHSERGYGKFWNKYLVQLFTIILNLRDFFKDSIEYKEFLNWKWL